VDHATRNLIDEHLKRESMNRPVVRLSFEGANEHSLLALIRYEGGTQLVPLPLAECEAHGRRINYLGENGT